MTAAVGGRGGRRCDRLPRRPVATTRNRVRRRRIAFAACRSSLGAASGSSRRPSSLEHTTQAEAVCSGSRRMRRANEVAHTGKASNSSRRNRMPGRTWERRPSHRTRKKTHRQPAPSKRRAIRTTSLRGARLRSEQGHVSRTGDSATCYVSVASASCGSIGVGSSSVGDDTSTVEISRDTRRICQPPPSAL